MSFSSDYLCGLALRVTVLLGAPRKEKKLFPDFVSSYPIKYSIHHEEIRVGKNKTVVKITK